MTWIYLARMGIHHSWNFAILEESQSESETFLKPFWSSLTWMNRLTWTESVLQWSQDFSFLTQLPIQLCLRSLLGISESPRPFQRKFFIFQRPVIPIPRSERVRYTQSTGGVSSTPFCTLNFCSPKSQFWGINTLRPLIFEEIFLKFPI